MGTNLQKLMVQEALQDAFKFKHWIRTLQENELAINGINEIYTRRNHNGDALFGLVLLDATTPEGDKIPPICFIKGRVVCLLTCLIDSATGERFLLLVRQRRICTGGYTYEHIAGMVDRDEDPLEVAVREAEEEAGLVLDPAQVHPLNKTPLYPSTGTSDESMYLFYTEQVMTKEEILEHGARFGGLHHEHERIYTYIATIQEALRLINNTNGLLQIYMYLEAIQKISTEKL